MSSAADLSRPACVFADRCEFTQPACRTGEVPLREIEPGHASACVRVQDGELRL